MFSSLRIKNRVFYGWVVLATFLVIGTIIYGSYFSFGVFFKSIESEFSLTRAMTSSVFSLQTALGSVFALIGGWALDRHGPRIIILLMGLFTGLSLLLTSQTNAPWQLFITYSLLLSIGTGAMYVVAMATVSRWFDKKRGFALGIAGSGAGLGMAVMAPFAAYLISTLDWRMAYIIIGSIAWLIAIPLSKLLRKDPHEIRALPNGAKSNSVVIVTDEPIIGGSAQQGGTTLLQATRTLNFWFLGFIWLLDSFGYLMVLTHIMPHATDMGIPAMKAAAVISLIGGIGIAGRVFIGSVSDKIGRKATAITCALFMAIAMLWLAWSQDLWMLYLFGVIYGLAFGGFDTSVAALVGDTFGLRNIGMIMGTLNIAWGIGSAVGPAMAGVVFDVKGNYSIAFLAVALAMLTIALLVALTKRAPTFTDTRPLFKE